MRKILKFPLLARVLTAIVLGVVVGNAADGTCVRLFLTFNSLFGQFLGFLIPLIIVGLVTPAIADMQALMIALYIAMDSFGTACNVTGDGAIAVIIDKIQARRNAA